MIVVDSLRYDTVTKRGVGMPYTVSQAKQFTEARSAGCWTLPATTSMFTGKMPHEHGATSQTRGFDPKLPTLAELLKKEGYNTHQCTANIATTEIFGLSRGFDTIYKIWEKVTPRFPKMLNIALMIGKPRVRKMLFSKDYLFQRMAADFRMGVAWAQSTYSESFDHAREMISKNEAKGEGSFMFINLMEAHFPYHVAPSFELTADSWLDKWRESMALYHTLNFTMLKKGAQPVKPEIEALLRERQAKGWNMLCGPLDNFVREMHENKDNLVIVCSDHGDNFGDQGMVYHFTNVTEGGNRIPLMWLDHNEPKAETLTHPVSSRFVFHDILRAAQIPSDGDSLFKETPTNLPMLQSYWYNNDDKTLAQFKYNQLCFVQGKDRFVYRDDVERKYKWMHAPITDASGPDEPNFKVVEPGFNPIEEVVTDVDRKKYLSESFANFKAFSDTIKK